MTAPLRGLNSATMVLAAVTRIGGAAMRARMGSRRAQERLLTPLAIPPKEVGHPMLSPITAVRAAKRRRPGSRRGLAAVRILVLMGLMGLVSAKPAWAQPTITGIKNPPAPANSTGLTPVQTAVADRPAVVTVASITTLIQDVLNAQKFTEGNHWKLVPGAANLSNDATFNITQYSLSYGTGGFREDLNFTLSADPPRPPGSTDLHWLQIINEDQQYNGLGYPIEGQQGFWKVDNGNVNGGPAAGPATGPYYDSNDTASPPAPPYSTPPTFYDGPGPLTGAGSYMHFILIPTWDVFTPASGGKPATESIDVSNYGVAWGFSIVPEPSSIVMMIIGSVLIGIVALRGRPNRQPAGT